MILNEISLQLQSGKANAVKELVCKALEEGIPAETILKDGLIRGMSVIGEKFKNNTVFVPDVMMAARAMTQGSEMLKPHLSVEESGMTGKVCLGSIKGDIHDIGKNLVKMMMECKGLEVIDLGVDVAPETFVETARKENCRVIGISALLTTTMVTMEEVVKAAERAGVRDQVKIMVGGAPVTEDFAHKIGADAFSSDAATAAEVALAFCKE